MFPLLIILIFTLLLAIGLSMLLPKRQLPPEDPRFQLSEHASGGLFGCEPSSSRGETKADLRRALLSRADEGDRQALVEARAMGDDRLCSEVLDTLIEHACRQETLDELVSHILENDALRANSNLANRVIGRLRATPERRLIAEALHIAALSDDAATFERAVDTVFQLWLQGRIPGSSADELRDLFESEYWVIASEARRSGAGFALRQRLAGVRRQLAIANRQA